jgi:two-component system OmpR family sensor kinase
MSGTDILDTEAPETPEPRGHHQGDWYRLVRRLSERTPLRTKLITAVLLLVIVALTVISFTSTYVLRSYLTTAHDPELASTFQQNALEIQQGGVFRYTGTLGQLSGDVYIGLQSYGDQISPAMPAGGNFLNNGNPPSQSVPNVPSTQAWAKANAGHHLTLGSVAGDDTWRVIVSPVTTSNDQTGTLIVAYDLGDINAVVAQLARVDVIVSVAIIIVLTVVAVGIVRSNLRPLDDIELTAGQIAAGHLNHRVPEGDPRTEIGSLGRSLNIMLTQIERAFHAQGEAEQAAHQSEERMRRFIADAAHDQTGTLIVAYDLGDINAPR